MTTQHSTHVRTYSRYALDAVYMLGNLIRINRIERKLSVQRLAERVGISRDMMQRIERGDPRCGIGLVVEAAAIVGVPLFETVDTHTLTMHIKAQEEKLRLLPKAIHKSKTVLKDDF